MNVKKIIKKIIFRLKIKQYKHIKYIFFPNPGSRLWVMSFSGFPGSGNSPSFNYMRTLQNVHVNKLFLMDDFGYSKNLGSYYLGENGDWFLPQEIQELIGRLSEKQDAPILIMIGSSKGGTSALYYAMLCKAQYAVIGAPQYHIGNYLNTTNHRPILQAICGSDSEAAIARMNQVVPEAISHYAGENKTNVFIHYSPMEHTYPEHIKDMISDLKANGFMVEEDCDYSYTDHKDVAGVFPKILLNRVKEIAREHGEKI